MNAFEKMKATLVEEVEDILAAQPPEDTEKVAVLRAKFYEYLATMTTWNNTRYRTAEHIDAGWLLRDLVKAIEAE